MDKLDLEQRTRVDDRLRTDQRAWFATTKPDGQPHTVPVWFLWDGGSLLPFTQPGSQKVSNLRRTPKATLHLEGPETPSVVFVEGDAELLAEPTAAVVNDAYLDKYAEGIEALGLTAESMAAEYAQPIRLRPTKVLTW